MSNQTLRLCVSYFLLTTFLFPAEPAAAAGMVGIAAGIAIKT
jgi:hypothetical protein